MPSRLAGCSAHFEECTVSLCVHAEDFDPEVVTQRIGITPTVALRKGERRTPEGRPAAFGVWLCECVGKLPGELATALLDRLPADAAFWEGLRRDYDVQIRFGFVAASLTGCFELEPEVAARLAQTGVPLTFHFYDYG